MNCLVAGASAGLGRALSAELAARGLVATIQRGTSQYGTGPGRQAPLARDHGANASLTRLNFGSQVPSILSFSLAMNFLSPRELLLPRK